ncbi:MAG: hormogonium polysaccharide biosynthesis protein HpsA [Cyanobacteria bacterium J06634_6]
MSAKKQTRNRTPRKPRSDFQRLARRFMSGLLRSLFFINRSPHYNRAGFVLPTTVLLLLVMTLTVGALSFRTASRTQSVFLAREQQVIDNIAAPAIDRAKAKLEYLFSQDVRMPGSGAPSSDVLALLVRNETDESLGISKFGTDTDPFDPYTLPDEERLDINGDDKLDNAWSFSLKSDGSETPRTIVYSLLTDDAVDRAEAVDATPGGTVTTSRDNDIKLEDTGEYADGKDSTEEKAKNLVVRNGPINTDQSLSACGGSREPEQGWLPINEAVLEKNFQITAFVSNGKGLGRANSAIELQQVRRASKGNRWGAWFRYDIELNPGEDFNWNGAIHTEGSMFVANKFKAHMISSHNSCLYTEEASEVTIAEVDDNNNGVIDATDNDGLIEVDKGEFQGQITSATPAFGKFKNEKANMHIFEGFAKQPTVDGNNVKLQKDSDSIDGTDFDKALEVQMDPVALFTQNISKHLGTSWARSTAWKDRSMAKGRVKNESQEAPYLDDFYRADDRYGPNPDYGDTNWVTATANDGKVNIDRTSATYDIKLGDEILPDDPNANNLLNQISGLDGYWERQAIAKGLRIIVGQRLELGNQLGWNFDAASGKVVENKDPLYPYDGVEKNKQKQRVTLRDNLAAVQGMVVYHYENDSGQYPLACIASAAHPGTLETLVNSRDFRAETFKGSGSDVTLTSNFLTGKGTNGWEYEFPDTFKSKKTDSVGNSFGAALGKDKPLGIALRNLAHFAGDPKGGSPSFTPVQDDGFVHPHPQLAMWGDYSILRRIFEERLDDTNWNSTLSVSSKMDERYAKLSPADKSSLHSAACTLGMLGQNLDDMSKIDVSANASELLGKGGGKTPQGQVKNEVGGPVLDGFLKDFVSEYCQPTSATEFNCVGASVGGSPSKKKLIQSATTLTEDAKEFINILSEATQIDRDRKYGFQKSPISSAAGSWPVEINDKGTKYTYNFEFSEDCNPADANGIVGAFFSAKTESANSDNAYDKAGVALVCASVPKYPPLHYLFPTKDHYIEEDQPSGEEYIKSDYIFSEGADASVRTDNTGVNGNILYRVVGDDDEDGIDESNTAADEQGLDAIAFTAKTAVGDFALPTVDTGSSSALDPETMRIIAPNGDLADLSLLDKVMFNGREGMAVRVLDIDLAKLTQYRNGTGDFWIPDGQDATSGIFYAAREDAMREDSITRPASVVGVDETTWKDCKTLKDLLGSKTDTKCWMKATGTTQTDPPLSRRDDGDATTPEGSFVGISAKPVDFAPDPDRRPYGFRLNAYGKAKDGTTDNHGDLSNNKTRVWGMSFITDNAAYIKGEFNPHTKAGGANDTLEEFEETLYANSGNVSFGKDFYDKRKTYNTDEFATTTADRWRVTEILADAVSILSENFVDGAVQEGFIRNRTATSPDFKNASGADSSTSFHNQQRPLDNDHKAWGDASKWLRVDGSNNDQLPIWVGRNGESQLFDGSKTFADATSKDDFELPEEQDGEAAGVIDAKTPQRMAATIIAGLVPSRKEQYNGGLHNFPRFIEDWNGKDLIIQGAFLQLNFSTASTGQFDVDAWEPGETPDPDEEILYYKPPARKWGYDVGLQYATAAPIAQRFVTLDKPRSEHYRELPVDDPYVNNLRCARFKDSSSGSYVDLLKDEEGCPAPISP